jgi:hypothetical protein
MIGPKLYNIVSYCNDRECLLIAGWFLHKSVTIYMFTCYPHIKDTSDGVDFC